MLITVASVSAKNHSKSADATSEPESGTSDLQQQGTITGTVVDSKGEPIIGATVMVKGTTIGVLTDISGKYTLPNVPSNATLSISYIGMASQEIALEGKSRLDVTLKEATLALDEVVVIGYGVQKKESVVGAISHATSEELQRSGTVTDFKQALTGQMPGLVTLTASGEPGGTGRGTSATNIFIRGMNTWNGGQPLILVDGAERGMDNIDVNEVENISILKDASATAVFGVKGANGVILITTKRGATGKPKLSFTYNAVGKMLSKLPKTMDSYDAILTRDEAIEREVVLNEPSWGDYIPTTIAERYRKPQTAENSEIYPNVNWQDALFKKVGMSHRAALDIQGGTKKVSYFGSLAYLHEGDMFKEYENYKGYKPNYNFDRFNFRSNLDFKLTRTTTLKVNLSGYYSLKNTNYNNEGSTGSADQWMWAAAYSMPPDLYLPQYSDGRFGWSDVAAKPNPVAAVYNLGIRQTRTTELNSDYHIEQKLDFITKGLSATGSLFYDNQIKSQGGIYDVANAVRGSDCNTPEKTIDASLYTGPDQDPGEYTTLWPFAGQNQFDWVLQPWYINSEVIGSALWDSTIPITRRMMYQFQLNYARKFGKHNVSAMGLMKREEYAKGSMFKNFREDWVFRGTYDYNSTYFFEMNGAYNGSEQFGPGYRFDFFPSLALGWNVTNEKFWKIDQINRLKLRYSIGMVGDDNVSGGRWLYASQLSYGGYSRIGERTDATSPYRFYRESVVGNPDIHWEKALKNNIGVEMGILKDMFSITYDYFTEDRTDVLLAGGSRSVPAFFGTTPPSANVGEVKSNGHELEIKFNKSWNTGWHFWSALSIAHTENEIIFKDDPALLDPHLKAAGYSIGQTKTSVSTGFYNNWDEIYASVPTETGDGYKLPGYYNYLDYNADGVYKSSEDAVPYGYSEIPQNTYNLTLGGDYKGFSVTIQLYGVNNVTRTFSQDNFPSSQDVVFSHVYDYWSEDNQDATSFLPRWKTSGENIGNYYVYDGSYLRLKTAEIAYTFDSNWVKKASLSSMRVFLNGNNLFFWSNLPDDREVAWSGGSASSGTYPSVKRITLGVDLTF
ncbi:MAG: TonB-dependent receptor [Bacteroidales bacterium]|nr:TonB-dependent receptor [Bacteroidales bacterium]